MKTLLCLLILLLTLNMQGAIIFFTDKPNSPPVLSDFFALQRNRDYINSSVQQVETLFWTSPAFTGNGSISGNFNISGNTITTGTFFGNGGGLTNIGGLNFLPITNGNGTNESFWGVTFFQEVDALNFFPTNLFTFLTNAQYLATDGNGKVIAGTGLPATNVLLSAGANIVFTTNVAGNITIASSGTNVITTITNNTFVNTNVLIVTSNSFINNSFITNLYSTTITNNTFVNTNTMILTSNAIFTIKKGATLVFETNAFIIDSNITASSAVITDSIQNLTNAANAVGVFTNSAAGPPSFGLVANNLLQNSSITIQGSAVALGGSTLAAGSSPFFNAANITNVQGGTIVGGTKTWQFDGSYLWPGDTLPATWTTNTPSLVSSSIQSAGPSIKAWQFSTSATNQVLLQVPMPADWDQSTVNVWVNLVSGTNSAVANATTNTWGCSAARVGTALGTAILVTNVLPGGTSLIETNVDFSTLTIAGSPKPGDYCLFQFQSRGGVTPFSATNTLLGVSFGIRYGVTNLQNNAITWP